MTTQEAIDAIVTFQTLPPQIDNIAPYRAKMLAAYEHINALDPLDYELATAEVMKLVEAYESGHSPADYDAML